MTNRGEINTETVPHVGDGFCVLFRVLHSRGMSNIGILELFATLHATPYPASMGTDIGVRALKYYTGVTK